MLQADSQSSKSKTEAKQEGPVKKRVKIRDQYSENLEAATRTINRSFTICLNDRSTNPEKFKKWGVYYFVGELFKIYFKLNTRSLAKSVLKVLKSKKADLPALDRYPKSHIVTFLFYSGVLHFMDEEYLTATEDLTKALSECHKSSHRNQELILMYLIPSMFLVTKRTPSTYLLGHGKGSENNLKYPVLTYLYKDMFDAFLAGNIHQFNLVVLQRRKIFVRKYIYLAIERIQEMIYTRLFKKVYIIMGKPTRMGIDVFSKALAISGKVSDEILNKALEEIKKDNTDVSHENDTESEKDSKEHKEKKEDDKENGDVTKTESSEVNALSFFGFNAQDVSSYQVECYLANMIYHGRMKGYISRERQTLVLSSKDAFPKQVKSL